MIEINRANSPWIYRINPYNPRLIDRRKNKHFARWSPYQTFDTEEEARNTLLQIERQAREDGGDAQ
jgi:hypothetical protein